MNQTTNKITKESLMKVVTNRTGLKRSVDKQELLDTLAKMTEQEIRNLRKRVTRSVATEELDWHEMTQGHCDIYDLPRQMDHSAIEGMVEGSFNEDGCQENWQAMFDTIRKEETNIIKFLNSETCPSNYKEEYQSRYCN